MTLIVNLITSHFTLLAVICLVFSRANGELSSSTKKSDESGEDDNIQEFRPTNEWQTVKKGQPIPRGLHVRMNLQTSQTEAKLIQDEQPTNAVTKNPTAVITVQDEKDGNPLEDTVTGEDNIFAHSYLKEALKNMKEEDFDQVENDALKKFRSYEELKKDMKIMNLFVKTDLEVLTMLLNNFTTSSEEAKISILTDLELLVHQFDNAIEFARSDGFIKIIYPSFNSTNSQIRAEAIKLLGSAVQNNPKVQIAGFTTGGVQLLLRTLSLDKDLTVRSRALYALSCLIRNFPVAQSKMISEGGLVVLSQVFDREENTKLQIKVVTLLHDLIEERIFSEKPPSENISEELAQKLQQYKASNFEAKLEESDWCQQFPKLLSESSTLDDDSIEKIVTAMLAFWDLCKKQFQQESVRSTLLKMEYLYNELASREPDMHYTDLVASISSLVLKLNTIKDEL